MVYLRLLLFFFLKKYSEFINSEIIYEKENKLIYIKETSGGFKR